MVNTLFVLNLAAAGALVLVTWRGERLRSMVVFHVCALVVAAALYAMMVFRSASVEIEPGKLPAVFAFRVIAAGLAYAPFLVFLVITYVRTLGQVAGGAGATTEMKLEDARSALRLGHADTASKILRAVLEGDPENVDAHTVRAEVHLKRGEHEGAVGSYRLAMAGARDDTEFAQFVFTVAVILNEHMGNGQAAARELDLIRKRMPGTPQAEKAQKWIVRIMDEAARED